MHKETVDCQIHGLFLSPCTYIYIYIYNIHLNSGSSWKKKWYINIYPKSDVSFLSYGCIWCSYILFAFSCKMNYSLRCSSPFSHMSFQWLGFSFFLFMMWKRGNQTFIGQVTGQLCKYLHSWLLQTWQCIALIGSLNNPMIQCIMMWEHP